MNIRNFIKQYHKKTHICKFFQFLDNFCIYHSILLQDGKGSVFLSSVTKRHHCIISIYTFEEPKLYHFGTFSFLFEQMPVLKSRLRALRRQLKWGKLPTLNSALRMRVDLHGPTHALYKVPGKPKKIQGHPIDFWYTQTMRRVKIHDSATGWKTIDIWNCACSL